MSKSGKSSDKQGEGEYSWISNHSYIPQRISGMSARELELHAFSIPLYEVVETPRKAGPQSIERFSALLKPLVAEVILYCHRDTDCLWTQRRNAQFVQCLLGNSCGLGTPNSPKSLNHYRSKLTRLISEELIISAVVDFPLQCLNREDCTLRSRKRLRAVTRGPLLNGLFETMDQRLTLTLWRI